MITADVTPLSTALKALADDTRVRMVGLLAHGELCVCHFAGALGIPQPSVSRNLAVLRHAGLVRTRRDRSWIYYHLAEQPDPRVERVLAALVAGFAADRALADEVARLRASKGPACP